MSSIFDKIFGTYSDRELKRIRPIADKVMALEDDMAKLSDAELKAKKIASSLRKDLKTAKHLMIFFLRHLR